MTSHKSVFLTVALAGIFLLISPCQHCLMQSCFSVKRFRPDVMCLLTFVFLSRCLKVCQGIHAKIISCVWHHQWCANKKTNSQRNLSWFLRRMNEPERKLFERKKGVFYRCKKPLLCRFIHQMRLVGRQFMMLGHPVLEHKRTYAALHIQSQINCYWPEKRKINGKPSIIGKCYYIISRNVKRLEIYIITDDQSSIRKLQGLVLGQDQKMVTSLKGLQRAGNELC